MNAVPKIAIIIASIREKRAGLKVGHWVYDIAKSRTDLVFELVDLKDWPLPMYAYAETTKTMEAKYTDELPRQWVEKVGSFDGYVVVTPEYNHGYPPSLKNAMDYVYEGWNRKPVAFVSYGASSGGVRAVQQLRQVIVELQMAPIRAEVNIPFVFRAFDEKDALVVNADIYIKTAQVMFDQLAWWATTLKTGRM